MLIPVHTHTRRTLSDPPPPRKPVRDRVDILKFAFKIFTSDPQPPIPPTTPHPCTVAHAYHTVPPFRREF